MKTARIQAFAKLLQKSIQELEKREFESVSNKELLSLVNFFGVRLREEAESVHCVAAAETKSWATSLEELEVKIPLID